MNPKLLAYAYIFGQFDYKKTPIVPPGTRVLVHDKADKQSTWPPNGETGWTIGPSPEHYRCLKCFFPKTRSERDSDTVEFFPHEIPFPKVNTDDFLRQSATDIIRLLTSPPSTTTISLQAGDDTRNGLLQLADLINRSEKIPDLIPLPPKPLPTKILKTLDNATLQRVLKEQSNIIPPQRVETPLIEKSNVSSPKRPRQQFKIGHGNELNYQFPNAAITFAPILAQISKA